MPAYIVSFEIDDVNRRNTFKEKLKTYKTFCPINKYCWAIVTEQKATEVRDFLKQFLIAADRMFVIRSGTAAAWYNSFGLANNDWLKQHL